MNDLEVVETIKGKAKNPSGIGEVFNDRVLVKIKNPKFKDFPPQVMSKYFIDDYERVKNFKVYEDDVWLVGFIRCGTSLTQEMLWLIVNDYDYEHAKKKDAYNRAQWFE